MADAHKESNKRILFRKCEYKSLSKKVEHNDHYKSYNLVKTTISKVSQHLFTHSVVKAEGAPQAQMPFGAQRRRKASAFLQCGTPHSDRLVLLAQICALGLSSKSQCFIYQRLTSLKKSTKVASRLTLNLDAPLTTMFASRLFVLNPKAQRQAISVQAISMRSVATYLQTNIALVFAPGWRWQESGDLCS